MFRWLTTLLSLFTLPESQQLRHSRWPAVRAEHILRHPQCVICGDKDGLEVHHVVPVHVDSSKELVPANLRTVCRSCHSLVGHGAGRWQSWNPCFDDDAKYISAMIARRKYGRLAA